MIRPSKTSTRYAIVVADFYRDIANMLLAGAESVLAEGGVTSENIKCVRVPGAFEIPYACAQLMQDDYRAIITLGAVVRGETPHFDYVAGECARGIMELNLRGETPVIFGVLTTDTIEQAKARASKGNKGGDAARTALAMGKSQGLDEEISW